MQTSSAPKDGSCHGLTRADPLLLAVGTATPDTSYTQAEIMDLLHVVDPRLRSIFANSSIERRCLTLPVAGSGDSSASETQGELLSKHRRTALRIGSRAIRRCLDRAGKFEKDVGYLSCVTTTGFLSPGLSALLCCQMSLPDSCARLDIVGMGCSAGLNALNAATSWCIAHPGRLAIVLCAEICSAAYVPDNNLGNVVVNSLFGDGAAAIAICTHEQTELPTPCVRKFSSLLVHSAADAMRFDWDEAFGKYRFQIVPEVPYVIGANIEEAIRRLLHGTGLRRADISHWMVHSGGKKVIDSLRVNLGLSRHDLRHTLSILRDYGNLSSGAFIFSYERLVEERQVQRGDHGVMITMGPGTSIETALLEW